MRDVVHDGLMPGGLLLDAPIPLFARYALLLNEATSSPFNKLAAKELSEKLCLAASPSLLS